LSKKGKGKGNKAGRKVRVRFRANRAKPARAKDWTRQYADKAEELVAGPPDERVKAKGDLSRKRTVVEPEDGPSPAAEARQISGVVLSIQGPIARIDDGDQSWSCTIRRVLRTRMIGQRSPVAVGDRVRFTRLTEPQRKDREGVIESVEPRKSVLLRRYGDRIHAMVANVDQVLVVASAALPPLKPHLIDRYLVAAEAGKLTSVICINKVDLDEGGRVEAALQIYRRLGYACVATSVVAGMGVEQLRRELTDKQTVIAGQSGVGKSSLLNAIQPGLKLKVGRVSKATMKGRHTTATAELLKLEVGGYVVDTPGIRQFELAPIGLGELEAYFVEFVPLVGECKYGDCKHIPEDGCAVKQAVERGQIDRGRYESYVRLFEELKEPLRDGPLPDDS